MADLGQTIEELELKVATEEHSIAQKETALKGLELNEMQMRVKAKQIQQSKTDILAQVEEHRKNIKALKEAMKQNKVTE